VELKRLPQIIGSLDEESSSRCVELFSRTTPTVIKVSSLEAAEIIKLIDNSYRDTSFAFANEVALISRKLGLDGNEVIQAANFGYSRNNIPKPGFVGGICLEKDPYILNDSAGFECGLILSARKINESLPALVLDSINRYVQNNKKDFNGIKVFISGFAFKGEPETDDLRGSPTIGLISLIKEANIKNIFGHDFIVSNENIKSLGVEPCSIEEGFKDADVVILMNNHKNYGDVDMENLVNTTNMGALIFDGWQIAANLKENQHIKYESLGYIS